MHDSSHDDNYGADSEDGGQSNQEAQYSVNVTDHSMYEEDDDRPRYCISQNVRRVKKGDLADRGANGGVQGGNLRTISKLPGVYVDLSGLDNHTLEKTEIGTCGGVTMTQRGPVILIFHRYALLKRGRSIHSCIQLEAYGNEVDD